MILHKCKNGRNLIVTNIADVFAALVTANAIPSVVLLSAWRLETVLLSVWNDFVHKLLERGCTYFVCAGEFAEELHDLIDDIIFIYPRSDNIATTFHNGETADDIVNFFVYTTSVSNDERAALVAILDTSILQDEFLATLLMRE
jgi:hypothetical protein